MFYLNDGSTASNSTITFIEDWRSHVKDASHNSALYKDLEFEVNSMSHTPSPSKKIKTGNTPLDANATPRGNMPILSHASDSISITTSSSRRSGSVSPKKRELELRQAIDFPLQRNQISEFGRPTPLMQDLVRLRKAPIIPHCFKVFPQTGPLSGYL